MFNKFVDNSINKIGISYSFKEVILKDGTKVTLKLIDTAGQEKYKSLSKSYFKYANGVLFIFSLNDISTFYNLRERIKDFEENNEGTNFVCKYLIGNKNDLEINVDQNLIEDFKKENTFDYYAYISSKDNSSIDKIFEDMSQVLYDDYKKNRKNKKKVLN